MWNLIALLPAFILAGVAFNSLTLPQSRAADDPNCITQPGQLLDGAVNDSTLSDITASVQNSQNAKGPTAPSLPPAYLKAIPPVKDALAGGVAVCSNVSLNKILTYCSNESEIHRFDLTDVGPSKINPMGKGAYRTYEFSAPQGARQDMVLDIEESGCTLGYGCNDSDWTMESTLLFLPRKVVPAFRILQAGAVEVTLPTGEKVVFDGKTSEITGGALAETAPIDGRKDRFKRKFASLQYTGSGIMIRSDQRAESTRSAVVWGQKKTATVTWGKKTCLVSPADIWNQEEGGGNANRFPTDVAFYAMLRSKCHWEVSAKDFN